MTDMAMLVLARARQFKFIREVKRNGKGNFGRWVEALQRIGGTVPGQPWCACLTSAVLGIAYDDKPPLPYHASCDEILAAARAKDMVRDTPAPGCLFFVMEGASNTDATHIGFVSEQIKLPRFGTIEGNASDTDAEPTREGWGVFERKVNSPRVRRTDGRTRYVFVYWWVSNP